MDLLVIYRAVRLRSPLRNQSGDMSWVAIPASPTISVAIFIISENYTAKRLTGWILQEMAPRNHAEMPHPRLNKKWGRAKWSITADAVSRDIKTDLTSGIRRGVPLVGGQFLYANIAERPVSELRTKLKTKDKTCPVDYNAINGVFLAHRVRKSGK